MESYDVVIVGYGPTGCLLALQLGRCGRRFLVLERQEAGYPLPRAAHLDDEVCRMLQGVGLPPTAVPDVIEPYEDFYEWRAADGEPLLRLDWRGRGPSGWNVSNFFHQPALETRLHQLVADTGNVTVRRGHQALALLNGPDEVTVEVIADSAAYQVGGRYVVGADGANSLVRQSMGTAMEDVGYFSDWLVVDVVPAAALTLEPPALQICDPLRPTTLVPAGPGRRRWEFMRQADEDPAAFGTASNAWELLRPWGVTQHNASLTRHAMYTFQARWAREWRSGRLLLAGDAAHQMPPFAGQGMCSGLRDAMNLYWKLDLVLGGADDALLDTYGPERSGHVRDFVGFSMELGNLICATDPEAVRTRDAQMKAAAAAGSQPPPRPLPRLGPGLHTGQECAGTLAPQGVVQGQDAKGLLDDVIGPGGALIGPAAALSGVSGAQRGELAALGTRVVALGETPGAGTVVDADGTYTSWLADCGAQAVLVRPDFYAFGAVTADLTAPDLVDQYLACLRSPHGGAQNTTERIATDHGDL
jgi:2-polyprenyl-6-methoxyphenol hydroxylase-like FAD-dependent oxidoreductase